jgi:hypothetical protein
MRLRAGGDRYSVLSGAVPGEAGVESGGHAGGVDSAIRVSH